jgi:hypothetical protein
LLALRHFDTPLIIMFHIVMPGLACHALQNMIIVTGFFRSHL